MPSWIEENEIKKLQVRLKFQRLVWSLAIFHNEFCKPKNSFYFEGIAKTLWFLLECMEKENPPDQLVLGNMLNNLNANILRIFSGKSGKDKKEEFMKSHRQTDAQFWEFNQVIFKASNYYTKKYLRETKAEGVESPTAFAESPTALLSPTLSPMPDVADPEGEDQKSEISAPKPASKDELLALIDALNDVPYANLPRCSDKIIHLFSHHPREMGLGSISVAFGLGSAVTTLIDWAQGYFSNSQNNCSEVELTDPQFYIPVAATCFAFFLFLRRGCKEFACPPKEIKYQVDNNKNPTDGSLNPDVVTADEIGADEGDEMGGEQHYKILIDTPKEMSPSPKR